MNTRFPGPILGLLLKAIHGNTYLKTVLFTFVLIIASITTATDCQNYTYSLGCAILLTPISLYVKDRLGTLSGLLFAYISIHSLSSSTNVTGRYSSLPMEMQNALSIHSTYSFLFLLIMVLGVLHIKPSVRLLIERSIPLYAVSNSSYVLWNYFHNTRVLGGHGWNGYLCYPSMNGCIIALGCAYLFFENNCKLSRSLKIFAILINMFAIYLSDSAIPYWLLFTMIIVRGASISGVKVTHLLMAVFFLSLGVITQGKTIIDSAGRFKAYAAFMDYLKTDGLLNLGTCIAGVKVFGATAQIRGGFMLSAEKGGFFWDTLHSDLLQSWFSWGWPAALLLLLVYLEALYRCYTSKRQNLLAFGSGVGIMGLVNFPHWYFPSAFLSVFFLVHSLDFKDVKNQ